MRKSKQAAIEKINACIAAMNAYDDNGVFYNTVTLKDVTDIYENSTYSPKLLALLPPEYRSEGKWWDSVEVLLYNIRDTLEEDLGGYPNTAEFRSAVAYYDNYSMEAKRYIMDRYNDEEDRLIEEEERLFDEEERLFHEKEILFDEAIANSCSCCHQKTSMGVIGLTDVEKIYEESDYIPEILALYPPELRNDLLEDDIRVDWIAIILNGGTDDIDHMNQHDRNTYSNIEKYYENYTEDAKKYILERMEEIWEDY